MVLIGTNAAWGPSVLTKHWNKPTVPHASPAVPWIALSAAKCQMLKCPGLHLRENYPFFQLFHVELCLLSFLLGSWWCEHWVWQEQHWASLGQVPRRCAEACICSLCQSTDMLVCAILRQTKATWQDSQSPFNCLLLLKNHFGKLIASVKLSKTFSEHNTLRVLSCLSSRAHCSVRTKQVFPREILAALNSSLLLWQRQLLGCAYTCLQYVIQGKPQNCQVRNWTRNSCPAVLCVEIMSYCTVPDFIHYGGKLQ